MDFIASYGLSPIQWTLAAICGLIIGMSKTGISGAGLIAIPVLAGIFGGKQSVGILLPMLIIADVFAVWFYNRNANWNYILKLLPWTIAGIIIATIVGNSINDDLFRLLIGIIVILGIVLLVYKDIKGNNLEVPTSRWFSTTLGLGSGFATMIGNASGPIMAYFLLSMRVPKNIYLGTSAWFFLIINLVKMPFHIFVWNTISKKTLFFDLLMIIPIVCGAFIGYFIVKYIPEKIYRIFLIITTIISAIALFR